MAAHNWKYTDRVREEPWEDDLETDLPDIDDLSLIPVKELQGKKISHSQAKTLRGRFIVKNQQTKMFECELCDSKR